jgi:hypothetical protein
MTVSLVADLASGGRLNSQSEGMVPVALQKRCLASQDAILIVLLATLVPVVQSLQSAMAGLDSRGRAPVPTASLWRAQACPIQNPGSHARR